MNRLILIVVAALLGCGKEAESTSRTSNPKIEVQKLFEHEGCTAYRFEDYVTVYYVRCINSDVTAYEQHTESCGKNCTRTKRTRSETVEEP